jgi:hypothetical protein
MDTVVDDRRPSAVAVLRTPGRSLLRRAWPGVRPRRWSAHWPLTSLLVGYPVWWALGLGDFSLIILAVPMVVQLWHRRPVRLPRGFVWWALFLLWVVLSAVAIGWQAPDTLASGSSKVFGYSLRLVQYLAAAVVLLYIGNLSEKELSRRRLVQMLGIFFLYTVAGGLLGVVAKSFQYTSPFALVLPASLSQSGALSPMVHPAAAQVTTVLGYTSGRPDAPFDYTNTWGAELAVLGVFFAVGWWSWGSHRRRIAAVIIGLVALVPAVYSLNRGLWIGLALAVGYLAVRLAARGRLGVLVGIVTAMLVGLVLLVGTPLSSVFTQRLTHQTSNDIRTALSTDAIRGALSSPIIGYGTDREVLGATNSIAIGKSPSCPQCGNVPIGSNGQFWLTLFSQGFPGIAFYTLFFLFVLIRYWRDPSPIGTAGVLVVILSLFFNFFYGAGGITLEVYMIVIGLLWRNEQAGRLRLPGSPARPAEVPA